ncbi:MAG: alpha/beta fold hydrolase [Bdellovibrionales bacterium]
MAFFQHRDKRMHYDLYAGLIPEDTLFIHGNLASNHWWQPTVQILKNRYKGSEVTGSAAMAEWLGCGQSSAPESTEDLEMMSLADDYIHLIKGLGLSDVNLVGHSTGGLIALCAMIKAPEMFKRAVLLDPVAADGVQFGPEMYDTFTKMSENRTFCDTVMSGTIYHCDVNSPLVQQLFDDAFHVDKKIWHGVPDVLKKTDLRKQLKQIKHPVLVLHGEHDAVLPIAGSRQIADELPHGKFIELKGQGHSTNVENPAKFVDLVCDFLFD